MPFVYAFDHKHRRAPKEMKDLLGGKGANLAEMMSVLKLPVPHGFTISTDACRAYMHGGWPKGLDDEVKRHVASLEKKMGRKLGDPNDPLLVSELEESMGWLGPVRWHQLAADEEAMIARLILQQDRLSRVDRGSGAAGG